MSAWVRVLTIDLQGLGQV